MGCCRAETKRSIALIEHRASKRNSARTPYDKKEGALGVLGSLAEKCTNGCKAPKITLEQKT